MMSVARSQVLSDIDIDTAESSDLARFAAGLGFGLTEYDDLHRWSIARPAEFWRETWKFGNLLGDLGDVDNVDTPMMGKRQFFPGGRVNVAENLLRGDPSRIAVVSGTGRGEIVRTVTVGELREEVHALARWLRGEGVAQGDGVATLAVNRVEALVSFLATLAIGGVWTSVSPDLSIKSINDRIGQLNPKVLFVSPQYDYNARTFDVRDTVRTLRHEIHSLERVVYFGAADTPDLLSVDDCTGWSEIVAATGSTPFEYERFDFNAPALVMYTSGTTGKPKAIVHGAGGILLRNYGEHTFHNNLRTGSTFFWYTNIAWMMYHYEVLSMSTGSTIVLFDDAPVRSHDGTKDCSVLWRLAENAQLTTMGVSPGYLRVLEREGYQPNVGHDLSCMKTFMATGAPIPDDLWKWVKRSVTSTAQLGSNAGGTEALAAFTSVSPLHRFRAGEQSCKVLGVAVDVVDDNGFSVVGQKGELVITKPFPGMPLTFLGEGGDERYKDAYFATYPNVWRHGDLAEATISGGFVIHGRSDATLNPGGVRIGTAEIYNPLNDIEQIDDAVVVPRKIDGDEEIVLFLKLRHPAALTEPLADTIRSLIRQKCSPRHVPAAIYQVSDIPQTVNGKRNEAAAREAVNGGDTQRFTSLANRECLKEYEDLAHAKGF
ncbi:acetoacetate--CoA ligase [Rhodococcus koreensis]